MSAFFSRTLCPLLIAALLPVQLSAQTAPQNSSDPAPQEEDLVLLNPFEVRAEKDNGYQATETLAGTRIRTDLKDVGAAITVLTREFLDDIGATNNLTLLQYTPNVEVGGTRSTFAGGATAQSISENVTDPSSNTRVRGLAAADNTRDYFVSDIPWDGYAVDRIDILRGPNSILFGLGKPAGIVNASLRGAEFRNRVQFQNRFGSYGSLRNTLDINRELLPDELAVRLIGLVDRENYRQKPAFQDDERIYGTARWEPKFLRKNGLHTTFRIKFEDGQIRSNNPRTLTPNDNISHFFRPSTVSEANPWGGLNKTVFDPYNVANGTTVGGDNMGQTSATDPDYNPWISGNSLVQQQQPVFLIDGATGNLYQAYGGLIPFQVRTSTGAIGGATALPGGFPTNVGNSPPFLSVNSPQDFARLYKLPNNEAGLYKQWGLQDPSVFDFYNILIDGPNKWELKKWDAVNLDLAQTAFGDRVGVNLTYDRQNYRSANEAFISGTPSLNVDLTSKFQDLKANPNAGRAFVSGSGSGKWTTTLREVGRASLFGELRARDFLAEGFLSKLLGRHRFNGVYSNEKYEVQDRSYQLSAADVSWMARRNEPKGDFDSRRPTAVVYLGPSLLSASSSAGLNLPGIQAPIAMNDAPLNHYYTVWNAPASVAFNAPWNRAADPTWSQYPKTGTFVQADNPANYVGWNSNYVLDMRNASDGDIDYLSTGGAKQLRRTESLAGSWQSFWWQDALVGTLGWRYDVVRTKAVGATRTGTADNGHLWISEENPPANYPATVKAFRYPDAFDTIKDHSVSGGAVLHLNRLFRRDPLPLNVSVAFNKSSNFEVTNRRVDLYGDVIVNPSGRTEDWSVRLATKDGKYSLRATRYEASVKDATSADFNTTTIGAIMATGLAWRNVFKYDLSAYTWDTANVPGSRNNFAPRPGETQADADALEKAAIAAWDELQTIVSPKLYAAWGFDPNKGADTAAEQAKMANFAARNPPNYVITEDVTAKGLEFEFVANPTRNWRISANASKSESFQSNIGGTQFNEYVDLISHYMNDTPAGQLRQFSGGATANTFQNIWNSGFYARYVLKTLQEGAAVPEIRKWRYSVTTNYSFREGLLKGVGVGGSYRWEDKAAIGYPLFIETTVQGKVFRYDLTKPYYGPSNDSIDLWVSYERKLTKKINWKLQLNVRNAFDKKGLIPVTLQPDGTTWAQVRTKPMQEWFVTNTFTF